MVAIGLVAKLISYTFVLSGFTMHLTYKKNSKIWVPNCMYGLNFVIQIIVFSRNYQNPARRRATFLHVPYNFTSSRLNMRSLHYRAYRCRKRYEPKLKQLLLCEYSRIVLRYYGLRNDVNSQLRYRVSF